MQAKDIDDIDFLKAVDALSRTQPNTSYLGDWMLPRWVMRYELEYFGPERVVLAKAKKLMNRGLLDGCPCGCRGDFVVTDDGQAFMTERGNARQEES